jgi:hypothetical protein
LPVARFVLRCAHGDAHARGVVVQRWYYMIPVVLGRVARPWTERRMGWQRKIVILWKHPWFKERRRCRGWRRRTVGGRAGVAREHARSKVPRAPATAETRWSNERLHADSITRIVCLIFNHNPSSPFSVLSPFSCLRIPFLSRPLPVLENLDHSKSSAAISLCLLLDLGKKTALSGFCLMATPLF